MPPMTRNIMISLPDDWKDLIHAGPPILHTYCQYLHDGIQKYGSKTIVFMQVGMFHELYGVENEQMQIGAVSLMANMLNIQMTRRDKNKPDNTPKNYLLCGFPSVSLERYISVLLDQDWTVIIVDQVEQPLDPSASTITVTKRPQSVTRAITRVVSPSTNIDQLGGSPDNNFLVSIFFQEDRTTHDRSNVLSVGLSAIDLTTGESYTYEVYSHPEDCNFAIDNTYRFLSSYRPREVVINSDALTLYDEEKLEAALDLHHYRHHIHINEVPAGYKKIAYQNAFLKRCFPEHGSLSPLEYLDLENKGISTMSYLLMLQFAYEHNEALIKGLRRPKVLENSNRFLILANNTINQLNLIPEPGTKGAFRSVLHVINRTSTSMGRRLLKHRLLNPITDPESLREHYNMIESLRSKKDDQSYDWQKCEATLSRIKDIERVNRRIGLCSMQPSEWPDLANDLERVKSLLSDLMDHKLLFPLLLSKNYVEKLSQICDCFKQVLVLPIAGKYNLATVEDNFFQKGYDTELDELSYSIKHYEQYFKVLTRTLSNFIAPGSDFVTLKKTDRNYCLNITKKRFSLLKEGFKKAISFTIDNKTYKLSPGELTEVPVSRSSSNYNVYISDLTVMSGKLETLHNNLRTRTVKRYFEFLKDFNNEWSKDLEELSILIGRIDVVKSGAKVADMFNYCKPTIVDDSERSFLQVKNLRHPIIERINIETKYVPHSLTLGSPGPDLQSNGSDRSDGSDSINNIDGMLVFGVNACGKSSLMKSVGVNLVLAQAGFYVAAEEFTYSPYEQILTRIVGNDNIFKGQSTFEVEMSELRGILNRATDHHSLVLGDEICHGTETISGVAIVAASVITLAKRGASFIFASHLHQLASMQRITDLPNVGSFHLRVRYDGTKDVLVYERDLVPGSGDPIYGLEVAKASHLNPDFISLAQEIRREISGVSHQLMPSKQSRYNKSLYIHRCQICGGPAEDTHHIDFQCTADDKGFIKHFHKNVLANLVVLCKPCHKSVHAPQPGLIIKGYLQTSAGPILDYDTKADGSTKKGTDAIANAINETVVGNGANQTPKQEKIRPVIVLKTVAPSF